MVLVLENLPNELFLFIFNYLSIIDLLYSFYRLNHRFSSLIRTIKHVHVDFSSRPLSKIQFIHILNQIRSLNIESLKLSTRHYVDIIPLFISYIPPSQLIHLRSLTLIDVDRDTIEKLVHNKLKLTSLSIESSVWRSIPRRFLPHLSHLIHCHLPTLDLLNGCHKKLTNLILIHCTTDNLIQLNTFTPNLQSLTLTLNNNINIPLTLNFPIHLISLKLILKSFLFTEFERLILMIDYIKNLTISFSNTEHEVHCFDQYLFGDNWLLIKQHVDNLQFNIIIHRTLEIFSITDIISKFNWFERKLICQLMDNTLGYHLFTLPFIDNIYTINSINYQHNNNINSNNFNSIDHLHLIIPNDMMQYSLNISLNCIFQNLQTLTIFTPYINSTMISFIDYLMLKSRIRILEIRLTSKLNSYQECFNKLIYRLPLSIETLILNTISMKFLSELLDNNNQLLSNIKRLICFVKNRDQFNTLILLLLEIFHEKSLIYLNISVENSNQSSNLLTGWLLKTNYLKKARIKCSDRQCAIWI